MGHGSGNRSHAAVGVSLAGSYCSESSDAHEDRRSSRSESKFRQSLYFAEQAQRYQSSSALFWIDKEFYQFS